MGEQKMKLGDTVSGEWQDVTGRCQTVTGIVIAWDIWHGRRVAQVKLTTPVIWCNPPRPGCDDVRDEVSIEGRLTLVKAGPALTADDVVSLADLGHGSGLTSAGRDRLGI